MGNKSRNKWLSAHQMTINGKKSMDIISKISLVASNFERYAEEANIREKTYSEIKKILELHKVRI